MSRQLNEDEAISFREERARYPWGDWSNGKTWEVIAGEDFFCSPTSFVSYLHVYARNNGVKVRTRTFQEPVRVVFKFIKPTTKVTKFKRERKKVRG